MTAEIVIMNKHGLAIAADSAITFSRNGTDAKKVYNSANKLFALSKKYPVGIMWYNVNMFEGVPWEAVIKTYREKCAVDHPFETTEQYFSHFLKFLKNTRFLPNEHHEGVIETIASKVFDGWILSASEIQFTEESALEKEQIILAKLRNIIEDYATASIEDLYLNTYSSRTELDCLIRTFSQTVIQRFNQLFGNFDFQPNVIQGVVARIIEEHICEKHSGSRSGIVVVGYGESERFPSMCSCTVQSRMGEFISVQNLKMASVTDRNPVVIEGFAQTQTVDLFLNGIDLLQQRSLNLSVLDYINSTFQEKFIDAPGCKFSREQLIYVGEFLDDLSQNIRGKNLRALLQNYRNEIKQTVMGLYLDELVLLARTLIDLTSIKLKITYHAETVGGPIDIAVISKGDGLVWIERKHYFDQNLNADFYRRRYGSTT